MVLRVNISCIFCHLKNANVDGILLRKYLCLNIMFYNSLPKRFFLNRKFFKIQFRIDYLLLRYK